MRIAPVPAWFVLLVMFVLTVPALHAQESATAFCRRYFSTWQYATTIEQVYPVMSETQKRDAERKLAAGQSGAQVLDEYRKQDDFKDVTVRSEEVSADGSQATLWVQGYAANGTVQRTAVVVLAKEDGAWRLKTGASGFR